MPGKFSSDLRGKNSEKDIYVKQLVWGEPQLTSAEFWGDEDGSSASGLTLQSFCSAHVGINWHFWGLPLSI